MGNPGRGDDGIGPALVSRLEDIRSAPRGNNGALDLTLETRLQLNVEDALVFSGFERVVVVDASRAAEPPYVFERLEEKAQVAFSTHALPPQAVLAWCRALYGQTPEAYVLAVRGTSWGLGQGLSAEAEINIGRALEFLKEFLGAEGS